jgi:hypothetical protein
MAKQEKSDKYQVSTIQFIILSRCLANAHFVPKQIE